MKIRSLSGRILLATILTVSTGLMSIGTAWAESEQNEEKGPHGGKQLVDENILLELAIFEDGVEPQYRAWISRDGTPVPIHDTTLTVELTRLGGKIDTFTFTPKDDYWLGAGIVEEPHSFDVAVRLSVAEERYGWDFESHEGRVEIDAEIALKAGIKTKTVAPGSINEVVTLYGKTVIDPSRISHIQARFPGTITRVQVNIGDVVKKGDVLAEVESNESLKRYRINAPFAGVITARHANAGELAQEKPLFTLIDSTRLWAELKVFPGQQTPLAKGQSVAISTQAITLHSTISHIVPSDSGQPFIIARALLPERDQKLTPGLLVKGVISIHQNEVAVAIENQALQSFRDWTVAFIKVGDSYEIRPLELGRSDGQFTEVLSGLNVGDEYVVDNSYLIKADIEKSGASHDH